MKLQAIVALVLFSCATARAQPQEGQPAPPQEGAPAPPQEGEPAPPQEGASAPQKAAPGPPPDDPEAGFVAPQEGQPETPAPEAAEAPAEGTQPAGEQGSEATPPAEAAPEFPPMTFVEAAPEQTTPGAEQPSPEQPCDPTQESCECPKNWGCWELIYTTKGTILGAKVTFTYSDANAQEGLDTGFVSFYSTEHYATRNNLTVHVLAFGGIGGGTARNEGSLGLTLDAGWRGAITETSGPFLRVGTSGMMTGHHAFYLSYFEPFQGRAGYQLLDGDTVLEAGVTNGFIPVGRFEPGTHARRDLSRTKELGGYLAIHRESYRADASFMHIFDPEAGRDRDDVEVGRATYCDYRLGLAVCADALFTRGEALMRGRERMTNALYFGITLGLSP